MPILVFIFSMLLLTRGYAQSSYLFSYPPYTDPISVNHNDVVVAAWESNFADSWLWIWCLFPGATGDVQCTSTFSLHQQSFSTFCHSNMLLGANFSVDQSGTFAYDITPNFVVLMELYSAISTLTSRLMTI